MGTTSKNVTSKNLSKMSEMILKNRPQIQEIQEKYGSMSYYDYVKQKNRINPYSSFRKRKKEIISTIESETERILGEKTAEKVKEQLLENDSMSTAEHTAPIGTAHTLGAGLSSAIPMFNSGSNALKNVITLSCSGPSFNNSLSFSRGFQFHIFKDKNISEEKITFFGRSVDPKTVLYHPSFTNAAISEIKKNLATLRSEKRIEKREHEKILLLLSDIYTIRTILDAKDFADQMTLSNYMFWKKLFPTYKEFDIPNYIMLSQEKIVINLLLNYHIGKGTPIDRFIFENSYYQLIEEYFEGITGAFNTKGGTGTFLFWYVTKENTRKRLFRNGNILSTEDKEFSINLNREEILNALNDKKIFPGLLLTFITLSFYYGMLLGGGASQPTYLTQMKSSYINMMKKVGDLESMKDAQEAVTDDFVFFRPHIAFIDVFNERVSATGMDMYLYGENIWNDIIMATKHITVNEFITILLPILYKQFCPDDKKEEKLMQVSRQDVEKFTGFDKKLPPIYKIL